MIHSQLLHLTELSETSVFSLERRILGWPGRNCGTYTKSIYLAHSKTEIKPQVSLLFTFAPGSPGIPLAPSAPGRP